MPKIRRNSINTSGNNSDATDTLWDVAVIGGGPAGMMAAGRAAEGGARVILIEKNDTLGKKLLITGGGRCNVTNAEMDNRKLLAKFNKKDTQNDKFLFSAFSQWSVKETLDFFHIKHMQTKIEAEQRVFPVTDKAQSVWNILIEYVREQNVTIRSNSPVTEFIVSEVSKHIPREIDIPLTITSVKVTGGQTIQAKSFILATGGKSRPETGSTGDGFVWLKQLGHTVVEPSASLVPLAIKDPWVKQLQGITLPEVKITILQNNEKQDIKKGKILFTHFGISGPTVLNMSKDVSELLKYGDVDISLDTMPSFDHGTLNAKLQETFKKQSNKKIKNGLADILPSALSPIILEKAAINADTFCHSITREERLRLITTLKDLRMSVKGLLGVDKAIVTSGGVDLSEVDFKTMRSRKVSNLHLVGDILNIDRPSGGFSLQLCWTTGYVAGASANK